MKYWITRHDPQRAIFLWQLNKWCKYIDPIKIQRYPMGNFWSRMYFRIFIWNAKIFSQQWLVLISILKKLSSFGYLPGRILCNFFAKLFLAFCFAFFLPFLVHQPKVTQNSAEWEKIYLRFQASGGKHETNARLAWSVAYARGELRMTR